MKKAMSKIAQINKEELSKVELALVDDLEREFKKISNSKEEITKEANKIGKLIFSFRDVLNNYNTKTYIKLLGDYQKAAKDLGVNIDNKYQKAFDDYLDEKRKQRNRLGI
jgi:radical SAM superfamily enzyme YgiQ (UPF0313 family)